MFSTSLCYLEQDGKWLMLHRVKKEHDLNEGKWVGIGGKFEEGESPEECMKREVFEETGLIVKTYRYRGIITFVSDKWGTEHMHLFHVSGFSGELHDCNEGVLQWVPVEKVMDLNLWAGDRIFLKYLLEPDRPFFSLKLQYEGDDLVYAALDGVMIPVL